MTLLEILFYLSPLLILSAFAAWMMISVNRINRLRNPEDDYAPRNGRGEE